MKLSMEDIRLMNALSQVTGVSAKDCLDDGRMVSFLINDSQMGRAIGKKAVNIKQLQDLLHKKVELLPFMEKAEDIFAKAMEVNYTSAKNSNGRLVVTLDAQNRAKAYSNNARIRRVREIIKRNFGLELVVN